MLNAGIFTRFAGKCLSVNPKAEFEKADDIELSRTGTPISDRVNK
jgi:hypothetical protein